MMEAMGGPEAWNNVHFVRFSFNVSGADGNARPGRTHLWDKWTGRYRLEQTTQEGQRVVLFNVNDKTGSVYLDGRPVQGEDATKALEGAYGAFINDMYWFAMPWKWLDPGVNLKYVGEQEMDGKTCDVVELTFGNVGLTPGDTYHGYVDKQTRMMTYWEYTLQSGNKGAWNWEYANHDGVMLSSNHTNAEGRSINMGNVAVFSEVADGYFTDPAMSSAQLQ